MVGVRASLAGGGTVWTIGHGWRNMRAGRRQSQTHSQPRSFAYWRTSPSCDGRADRLAFPRAEHAPLRSPAFTLASIKRKYARVRLPGLLRRGASSRNALAMLRDLPASAPVSRADKESRAEPGAGSSDAASTGFATATFFATAESAGLDALVAGFDAAAATVGAPVGATAVT